MTLAVGAEAESSAATGVGGNQLDNSATNSGAVYVVTRSGTTWTQQAYIKASNTGAFDEFGYSVAISFDGSTLAVGADQEASAATSVDGNQADNSAPASGAVFVFTRTCAMWMQQAYVKASNTDADDQFGEQVALSSDGSTLVVAADLEASAATGVGGNQADNSATNSFVPALSADASSLAVGAFGESSAATGINANQADTSVAFAGAACVFAAQ